MGLIVQLLVAALVIFIVDKLMTGIQVDGPVACIKVAAVNAVLSFVLAMVIPAALIAAPFSAFGANAGAIAATVLSFLIAGLSLFISDKLLSDFKVAGFQSAVVAAVLIAVVGRVLAILGL